MEGSLARRVLKDRGDGGVMGREVRSCRNFPGKMISSWDEEQEEENGTGNLRDVKTKGWSFTLRQN